MCLRRHRRPRRVRGTRAKDGSIGACQVALHGVLAEEGEKFPRLQPQLDEKFPLFAVRQSEDPGFAPRRQKSGGSELRKLGHEVEHGERGVIHQQSASRRRLRNRAERLAHARFVHIHADAFPHEKGFRIGLVTGSEQHIAQLVAIEVDACVSEVRGRGTKRNLRTLPLVLLGRLAIHLEYLHILKQLREAVGARIEARSQDDRLGRAVRDGLLQFLVDELGADQHHDGRAHGFVSRRGAGSIGESRPDRVLLNERDFLGSHQLVGQHVGISHRGVRFSRAQRPARRHHQ